MSQAFRVGVTSDALKPDGTLAGGDVGLGLLDGADGVEWEFLPEDARELRPEHVRDYDALLLWGRRLTAATLEGVERLTIVARFGVGYDTVDVEACTRQGVLLTITPDGVRRPVASAFMAFLLALSHKMMSKDRLTRAGRWAEWVGDIGVGLTGRVLGLVGMGNIGREVFVLAAPFGMRHLGCDPYVTQEGASEVGAELVDLETLLRTADFLGICCPLNAETRHLINAERLALMKETAYLINVARGPIVDQPALTEALRERRIQGAALDALDPEPVDPSDPILTLENVIVTPHAMALTDQGYLGIGESAIKSVLEVASGRVPDHTLNRSVLDHPRLQEKLRRYAARSAPTK